MIFRYFQHRLQFFYMFKAKFIHLCTEKGIEMNRKAMADLALNNPEAFKALVEKAKG